MNRRGESGFALLLVFAMAGVIAISLYIEIPRVAFESQRAQEELLIERGEQYARAIKVFVHQNGRYPQNVEELENFNTRRSLRKRYADPMTGKDEWRIIHIAAPGMFTDSLVYKPKDDKKNKDTTRNFIGEGPAPGSTLTTGQPQNAVSDRPSSEVADAPGAPHAARVADSGQPQQGRGTAPQPPDAPGNLPTTQPGSTTLSTQPGIKSAPGGVLGSSQRPQGWTVPGGVAGIASTSVKKGIKIYNGRRMYNEWEFIYDVTKDRGIAATAGPPR